MFSRRQPNDQPLLTALMNLLLRPELVDSFRDLKNPQTREQGLGRLSWSKWGWRAFRLVTSQWTTPDTQAAIQAAFKRMKDDLNALEKKPEITPNEQAVAKLCLEGVNFLETLVAAISTPVRRGIFWEMPRLIKTLFHGAVGAASAPFLPTWLRKLHGQLLAVPAVGALLAAALWYPSAPFLLLLPRLIALFTVPGFVAAIGGFELSAWGGAGLLAAIQPQLMGLGYLLLPFYALSFLAGGAMLLDAMLPMRFGFLHQAINAPDDFAAKVADQLLEVAARYRNTYNADPNSAYGRDRQLFLDKIKESILIAEQLSIVLMRSRLPKANLAEMTDEIKGYKHQLFSNAQTLVSQFEGLTNLKLPLTFNQEFLTNDHVKPVIVTPGSALSKIIANPVILLPYANMFIDPAFANDQLGWLLADDQKPFHRSFWPIVGAWIRDAYNSPLLQSIISEVIRPVLPTEKQILEQAPLRHHQALDSKFVSAEVIQGVCQQFVAPNILKLIIDNIYCWIVYRESTGRSQLKYLVKQFNENTLTHEVFFEKFRSLYAKQHLFIGQKAKQQINRMYREIEQARLAKEQELDRLMEEQRTVLARNILTYNELHKEKDPKDTSEINGTECLRSYAVVCKENLVLLELKAREFQEKIAILQNQPRDRMQP